MKAKLLVRGLLLCATVLSCGQLIQAANVKPAATQAAPSSPDAPKPTLADVPYGTHPKQVLDFYKAESATPTPLVFYIHGGGWMDGSKAAIQRKRVSEGRHLGRFDRVSLRPGGDCRRGRCRRSRARSHDAARALQFVRSKAKEWNIDKTRIGATGGSAGACSSLWLAFHDDMADPKSSDPVARESTRLPAPPSTSRRPRSTPSR